MSFPDALIFKLCSAPGLWEHSANTFLLCRAALDLLRVPDGPARKEILLAALCHDLGKAEWPEAWFSLPRYAIAENEWVVMKAHPLVGADLLREIWPQAPEAALETVRRHHERPGGSGYPHGLQDPGWQALLVAACDVTAAMLEDRPYRPGLGLEAALAEVSRFAPEVVVRAVGEAAAAGRTGGPELLLGAAGV
ncbi:MAG: HD domain-containing protein [Firmicutes bacterium]|nr:HD domain-containing protein [Bacillota bacterium]